MPRQVPAFPSYGGRSIRKEEYHNDYNWKRPVEVVAGTGGGGIALCVPWDATITNVSENGDPEWEVFLNVGTINNFVNPAFGEGVSLGTGDLADIDTKYLIFDITLTNGRVSGLTYKIENSLPSPQEAFPVEENEIPTGIKIVAGVFNDSNICMTYHTNLQLLPEIAFKQDRPTPDALSPPYINWWTLKISGMDTTINVT
jgi:hypothetical protein